MYADEIRRQAEGAARAALPAVSAALWRAFGEGKVTEAEAESLSALIEARQHASTDHGTGTRTGDAAPLASAGIVRRHGSRPRSPASMGRRRTWAMSGRLPPALAAKFTMAEAAVLAVVAAESAKKGDCRLAVGHLAAVAGVSPTTVRNALREAQRLGLLTIELRRVTGFRNLPNVVRIISAEWTAWNRLARRDTRMPVEGGGCKSPQCTPTAVPLPVNFGPSGPSKGCRGPADDPSRRDPSASSEPSRTHSAMR